MGFNALLKIRRPDVGECVGFLLRVALMHQVPTIDRITTNLGPYREAVSESGLYEA
jgi:hypothetical protein